MWYRMAVINDMLEQQQQQESESIPNSFLSQVIELIREINQLLNNPVVLQRFNNQIPQQPVQTTLPQIRQQEFNEEQFIKFIQTPKGKQMLISGLERVKQVFGDLRISEMISALKGGSNVKPNK